MSAPAMRTQAEKLPEIKPWGRTAAYGIPPVAFSNPKLTFWGWADYTLCAEFQPLFFFRLHRGCAGAKIEDYPLKNDKSCIPQRAGASVKSKSYRLQQPRRSGPATVMWTCWSR